VCTTRCMNNLHQTFNIKVRKPNNRSSLLGESKSKRLKLDSQTRPLLTSVLLNYLTLFRNIFIHNIPCQWRGTILLQNLTMYVSRMACLRTFHFLAFEVFIFEGVRIMAFSATCNTISVISLRSILFLEKIRENHWQTVSHNVVAYWNNSPWIDMSLQSATLS
jgi:hypothetical protein